MKQGNYLNSASRFSIITLALLLSFSSIVFAQDADAAAEGAAQSETTPAVQGGDAAAGKALFNANCAACHKLYNRATGPALYNVTERRDREWLYQWIKNNRALIDSGDPEAIAIYEEYNQTAMNLFPQLSNADIDDILAYTETPKPEPVAPANAGGGAGQSGGGVSSTVILAILAVVLVMLVAVLLLVNNTLRKFAVAQGVALPVKESRKPIWKAFVENQFLVLVSLNNFFQ